MRYCASAPVILAAALLALFSCGLLGQTHILSSLWGAAYVAAAADSAFFILTLLYALILWKLRQIFPSRFVGFCLWILSAALLFILFMPPRL